MDRPDLELLRGAIDMHAHTAPALFKRHIDDAALAEHAIKAGMRGFVLKDHDASTTGRAYYVNRMYPQVQSFGAVVLNRSISGLNPYVAEAAIHYGARVVWMPSNHSKHHADYFGLSDYPQFGRPRKQLPGEGVAGVGGRRNAHPGGPHDLRDRGRQRRRTRHGHLSLAEIRALQDAAIGAGVTRFIVTHANWSLCKLDLDVQRELIAKGATLEYVASSCVSPIFWEQQPEQLAEWIEKAGGDHLVFGSDLGQYAARRTPKACACCSRPCSTTGSPTSTWRRWPARPRPRSWAWNLTGHPPCPRLRRRFLRPRHPPAP